jgi:hypothetical protein
MLGQSTDEAAQTAAAALGIKLGGGEKADDARRQGLSPQTMAAMEGLWAAMDDGAIVLLSKAGAYTRPLFGSTYALYVGFMWDEK